MQQLKSILKLLFTVTIVMVAGNAFSPSDPVAGAAVMTLAALFITGFVLPVRFFSTNTLNMGLDVNVWKKYIIEKLRKTNAFMFKSRDDSGYVLGGAVVYIPQAGDDPTVEINSNVYPGVAVRRADTDINYPLDAYRTVPTHIPWVELQTISYDKIDSVLGGHTAVLSEAVADNLLNKWAATDAGFMVKTSGADVGPVTGQVGDRKGFSHTDLKKAMIKMNTGNVLKSGRLALIDDNMYEFFYDSLTSNLATAFANGADLKNGIVGRLHGFDIMTRSSALAYSNADAVKAYGSALGATDNLASLCWHPDTVCRAFGDMKPFQNKDDARYYGDIYSMIVRAGGRKERADNKGVVAIIQAAAA